MVEFTQRLLRESEYVAEEFWAKADRDSRSVEHWEDTAQPYRDFFYDEVDRPLRSAALAAERPHAQGLRRAEVHRLRSGARRVPRRLRLRHPAGAEGPQAGRAAARGRLPARAGRPAAATWPTPRSRVPYYHQFAAKLAERGFITYRPAEPYIGADRFRTLQRKSNPLKKSLFSIIVPQHQQIVDWLGTLPIVDPERIAFYGLSYGGKSAMRIPALVKDYCLSICSGDFNEWIRKNDVDAQCRTVTSAGGSTRCSSSTWAARSTTPRWPG